MRELKFRVWDKKNKEWLIGSRQFNNRIGFYNTTNAFIMLGYPRNDIENIVIEQFTGLKDRNDQEIYENDIIEWRRTQSEKKHVGNVFWDIDGWRVAASYGQTPGSLGAAHRIKVIGNTHEAKVEEIER